MPLVGGVVALLALSGLLPGSDWADGSMRAGVWALIAVVVVVLSFGRWVRQERWEGHTLSRRMIALGLGTLLALIILYSAGVSLVTPLHRAQGALLASQQDYAGAAREYARGNDRQGQIDAYYALGKQLRGQRQYARAVAAFQNALQLNPAQPQAQVVTDAAAEAYIAWAEDFQLQQQYAQAIDQFTAAHQLAPSYALDNRATQELAATAFVWGKELQAAGQYAQAITEFGLALQFEQDSDERMVIEQTAAEAYFALGQEQRAQGQFDQAVSAFAFAVSDAQTDALKQQATDAEAEAYIAWGKQLQSQQQYSTALDKFSAAVKLAPSPALLTQAREGFAATILVLGDQALAAGQFQQAVGFYSQVLQDKASYGATSAFGAIYHDAAKAYLGLGQQILANGQCSNAADTYNTLIQQFGDTPEAQTARNALAAPQNVTGQIVDEASGQAAPNVRLFLSGSWSFDPFNGFTASDDYAVRSNGSGNFTFAGIQPGSTVYLISYIDTHGYEGITTYTTAFNPIPSPSNTLTVHPLCATDAGTVDRF